MFRPDLFESHIEVTSEMLEVLAASQAVIKLNYISESPLKDRRHLHFMVYLLETMAELTRCRLVFDSVAERLFFVDDLRDQLRSDPDGSRPELHVRTIWKADESGGKGGTRGLGKVGVPELETPLSSSDHQVIIREVLDLASLKLWETPQLPDAMTVHAYDDEFKLSLEQVDRTSAVARILRIHDKS